jgi:hypothetical protein
MENPEFNEIPRHKGWETFEQRHTSFHFLLSTVYFQSHKKTSGMSLQN